MRFEADKNNVILSNADNYFLELDDMQCTVLDSICALVSLHMDLETTDALALESARHYLLLQLLLDRFS